MTSAPWRRCWPGVTVRSDVCGFVVESQPGTQFKSSGRSFALTTLRKLQLRHHFSQGRQRVGGRRHYWPLSTRWPGARSCWRLAGLTGHHAIRSMILPRGWHGAPGRGTVSASSSRHAGPNKRGPRQPPTPLATRATRDRRSALPRKFLGRDPTVALLDRLPLRAREGRAATPGNGMAGRRSGAGKSFASDCQHQIRTLQRPAERTKIEASRVAIRGIVKGVAA